MAHKRRYFNYIRNHWALPYVHAWVTGPVRYTHKIFPWKWEIVLTTQYGEKSGWHYYQNNIEDVGLKMVSYFKTTKNLQRYQRLFDESAKKVLDLAAIGLKKNWVRSGNEDLARTFNVWNEAVERFAGVAICLDATDEILERIFESEIKRRHASLTPEEISLLLTPNQPTYIEKEAKDMAALAARLNTEQQTTKVKSLICAHVKKWWWKDLGWGQLKPLTEKAVARELRSVERRRAIIGRFQDDRDNHHRRLAQKKALVKTLPPSAQQFLRMFEVLAVLHDRRKEVQMKMLYAMLLLGNEIMKRRRLPRETILTMTPEEIIALADTGRVSKINIEERKTYYWCFATQKKAEIVGGARARRLLEKSGMYTVNEQHSTVVQGIVASRGKIIGSARVGFEPKELARDMKHGDVLITGMTSPDYVPAMRKASAVITDDGGITCHAAIVSRELGIPCIIGTKVATQFFKTGDLLEVNANHGWIKKVNVQPYD